MTLTFALLLFVSSHLPEWTQPEGPKKQHTDSLEKSLPTLAGREKLIVLIALAEEYRYTDTQRSIRLLQEALPLAQAVRSHLLSVHNQLASCFTISAAYDSAEKHFAQAIQLSKGEANLAQIYSSQAKMYAHREQYTLAQELHFKAREINERIGNKAGLMGNYLNLASLYAQVKNHTDAAHYDSIAYDMAKEIGDADASNMILSNLACTLEDMERYEEARKIFARLIPYYEKHQPASLRLANVYFNVAHLHATLDQLDSSYQYVLKALPIYQTLEAGQEITSSYILLSNIELALGKTALAEEHGLMGYRLAGKFENQDNRKFSALSLMKIYLRMGNMEKAMQYETQFHVVADSLEQHDHLQSVMEMQTRYETQKKVQENVLLKKEAELKDTRLAKGTYMLLSSLLGMLLLLGVAFILFIRGKNRKRMNTSLVQENEKLKIEKLTVQLNHLRDQISPHFLFNSLGTLQNMVDENDPKAGTFLQSLAEVYRYILETDAADLVSVQQELSVAEAYIFLLRTRFDQSLHITVNLSDAVLCRKIPPFSLQLLIENAVKHNIATPARPLHIDLFADDQHLCVRNTLQPKRSVVESTRTGLTNLQKRFTLLGNYDMSVVSKEPFFSVALPLI
jgi:tetratricopeptide (TPR) repeat protein